VESFLFSIWILPVTLSSAASIAPANSHSCRFPICFVVPRLPSKQGIMPSGGPGY
jgi:hypothetical protein